MTHRDPDPASPGAGSGAPGLSDAELEAESAVELPDREAMSIVGLPGVGLPGAPVDLPGVPDPVEPIDPQA